MAPNYRITDEWWTERYLEGNGRCLIGTEFWHLPQETDGIQTKDVPTASLECYRYVTRSVCGLQWKRQWTFAFHSNCLTNKQLRQEDCAPWCRSVTYIGSRFQTEGGRIDTAEGKETVPNVQAPFWYTRDNVHGHCGFATSEAKVGTSVFFTFTVHKQLMKLIQVKSSMHLNRQHYRSNVQCGRTLCCFELCEIGMVLI
jgi:hypothetical protein